jgi:hypothetical protein
MIDPGPSIDLLTIDGFNVIVTVESAIAGGVLLKCMDGTIRDLASVHGSYRKVEETVTSIGLVAEELSRLSNARVVWLLDQPVSNSGRLAGLLREIALDLEVEWEVRLTVDVDGELIVADGPVATSDSVVLDQVPEWVNLARHVVDRLDPPPWIIDLSGA